MKIHEYQGKQILGSYDIPIQDGIVVENKENALNSTNTTKIESKNTIINCFVIRLSSINLLSNLLINFKTIQKKLT